MAARVRIDSWAPTVIVVDDDCDGGLGLARFEQVLHEVSLMALAN